MNQIPLFAIHCPTVAEWVFLFIRAGIGLTAGYMGVHLLVAFVRNHYAHKPKRWLVGWQGIAFTAVGLDGAARAWSRAQVIYTGHPVDVTSWIYSVTAVLVLIGCAGTLYTWMNWPTARVLGAEVKKKGKTP